MKKRFIRLLFTACITLFLSAAAFAQGPPPPPADPSGGGGNPPVGGGAPIGSGLITLVLLGAAYGATKIYKVKSEA